MDLSKVPKHARNGLIKMNADKPLASTGSGVEHAKATLERYIDGQSLSDQASALGVTRCRLNRLLLNYAEDDWRHAQIAKAMETLEDAEIELGDAALTPDGVSVSRAREKARLAQWKLERLLARLFAQKQEVTHNVQPVFTVNIGAGTAQVIADAEVIESKDK